MTVDRSKGEYELDKVNGAQRIIHATTRMLWANEDPLAINLLAQSADRITADLTVAKTGSDLFWDSPIIIRENKNELLNIIREASNFVKHADREPHGKIQIHDLVASAEMATFMSIMRTRHLTNLLTCHMKLYLDYHYLRYPDHLSIEGIDLGHMAGQLEGESSSRLRLLWGQAALLNSDYVAEAARDTIESR